MSEDKFMELFKGAELKKLNISEPKYLMTGASLRETIELMRNFKIGSCIIIDESVQLKGIITERDILMKVAGNDIDYDNTPVSDYMTANPNSLNDDATIYEAIKDMQEGRYRHIPIVNEDNRPIGIISIKDVMSYMYNHLK